MSIGPRPPDVVVAIDNDILNLWRTRTPAILKTIAEYIALVKSPPALTSTTIFEMMHGFEKVAAQSGTLDERAKRDKEHTQMLISECTILPFNQAAAEIAAYIFPRLSRSERARHWKDLFVAATALAHDYGVATRNRSDFELIVKHAPPYYPPLRIEIWKAS